MTAKEHKKILPGKVLVDRITGQPLMTIEFFLIQCFKMGVLNQQEIKRVYDSGILPDDFPRRIRLYEIERNKN